MKIELTVDEFRQLLSVNGAAQVAQTLNGGNGERDRLCVYPDTNPGILVGTDDGKIPLQDYIGGIADERIATEQAKAMNEIARAVEEKLASRLQEIA